MESEHDIIRKAIEEPDLVFGGYELLDLNFNSEPEVDLVGSDSEDETSESVEGLVGAHIDGNTSSESKFDSLDFIRVLTESRESLQVNQKDSYSERMLNAVYMSINQVMIDIEKCKLDLLSVEEEINESNIQHKQQIDLNRKVVRGLKKYCIEHKMTYQQLDKDTTDFYDLLKQKLTNIQETGQFLRTCQNFRKKELQELKLYDINVTQLADKYMDKYQSSKF